MKKQLKILILLMVFTLILLPAQSVAARGLKDGPVIFGGSYTLKSGEALDGDVVVFGGIVTIEEDARVNGDVVIFGGSLTIDGQVNGEVALLGGAAVLGEEAIINGNLSLIGATMTRADGAQITGEITYSEPGVTHTPVIPRIPGAPEIPFVEQAPLVFDGNPLWVGLGIFGRTLAMSLLAMLVALFLAEPTERVGRAIAAQAPVAGGLGLLTIILAPAIVLVLMITVVLIPIGILAILTLMAAMLYGWVALGFEVGARFTKMIGQDWQPPLTAAFGAALLTLISASFNLIPCVGWLIPFLLITLSLGGVIVSRFGTQLPQMASPASVPAADEPVPDSASPAEDVDAGEQEEEA